MPRYVAFLRAINVGGHVVKMQRLKDLFVSLGLEQVETFIASGNVIFSSKGKGAALERKIERLLARELGYEVKTFIRSFAELRAIRRLAPSSDAGDCTLYIGFLAEEPCAEAARRLAAAQTRLDEFRVEGRELYWRRKRSADESRFSGATLEKMLGMPMTLRNINTVDRIVAKYECGRIPPPRSPAPDNDATRGTKR
jgi:uncharacterized protein (DUF1697 family)